MAATPHAQHSWRTSSFGDTADTTPMELSDLGAHLGNCRGGQGRLTALHWAAESVRGFVAPRLITSTVLLLVLLLGLSSLLS